MKFCSNIIATIVIALACCNALAQSSRSANVMEFLDVPQDARLVASGGLHAVSGCGNVSLVFHNPSAVADSLDGAIDISVSPVGAGIKYASGAYSFSKEDLGNFVGGIQFAGYGEFARTDDEGNELGSFKANEVAFYLNYSKQMTPHLRLGATFKPVLSTMDSQRSFALTMDFGATFSGLQNRMTAGLVFRNLGAVVVKYDDTDVHPRLPFDVKLALTYKAEHAPFRFLLTLKNLTHWDLATNRRRGINPGDNLLRHTIIGLEFVPVKAFYFAMGYDQRKRRELTDKDAGGLAGISWGAGLKVRNIEVRYAHNRYHIAGALNCISLATNWRRFAK